MQFVWKIFAQQPRFECWENRELWPDVATGPGPGDARDAHQRELVTEAPGEPEAAGPYSRLAFAILAFDIFPPRLVTPVLRRRPVEVGDTVGICYHLLPGMDLFFAARVMDRFDERYGDIWKCGFTYRTLVGHPMIGEETFSVEKNRATGRIVVALRSWSRPGIVSARLFYPLVRRLQLRAGQAATEYLAGIVSNQCPKKP